MKPVNQAKSYSEGAGRFIMALCHLYNLAAEGDEGRGSGSDAAISRTLLDDPYRA
jgi:hypothetical protein